MSLSSKLSITDVDLKAKRVLIRVDFNVPIQDGVIMNPAVCLPEIFITTSFPLISPLSENRSSAADDQICIGTWFGSFVYTACF
jgi:hypothetical protein